LLLLRFPMGAVGLFHRAILLIRLALQFPHWLPPCDSG
jgi:hypothetical protein